MAAFPGLVFTFNSVNEPKKYSSGIRTFTLTFGDQAENHVGMQKIGSLSKEGFTCEDLLEISNMLTEQGRRCELIDLNEYLPEDIQGESASVLIIRNGLQGLLTNRGLRGEEDANSLFEEMAAQEIDTKAKMYGRVVNKHARYNLCFDFEAQEPNYEEGKGRIVAYSAVPLLNKLRLQLPQLFGSKADGLVIELNDYYDVNKCGIGFHGDTERRKVIGVRLGATIPLHYQWFSRRKAIGERVILQLHHGDIYIMSQKAVGFDWKRSSQVTVRHAAGCAKFVNIK